MSEESDRMYQEERAALQKLNDADKRRMIRDEWARQECRAQHAADIEAARIEAERIANLPAPEQTEYPVAGLHFINGVVQPAKESFPSISVQRTASLTQFNKQQFNKPHLQKK
jgi:hypothetical protein